MPRRVKTRVECTAIPLPQPAAACGNARRRALCCGFRRRRLNPTALPMSSRLTTWQRTALAIFVVAWTFCIVAKVMGFMRPAFRAVYVEVATEADYPTVKGFFTPAAESLSVLRIGDRLLRLSGRDLRGQSQLFFETTESDVAWRTRAPFRYRLERQGRPMEVTETRARQPLAEFARDFLQSVIWAMTAVLILLRARRTPGTRKLFYGLATFALFSALFVVGGPADVYVAATLAATFVFFAVSPMLVTAYLSFPEEARLYHGWNKLWPWLLAPIGVAVFSIYHAVPFGPTAGRAISSAGLSLWTLIQCTILTFSYRRSSSVGRRQLKWILYSVYVGALVAILVWTVNGIVVADSPVWAHALLFVSGTVYPISVLIAALRFDLLDIDRLLGATVGYNLVGIVVVAAGFIVVPTATAALSVGLGVDPTVGRTTLSLCLAGVLIFGERRLRPHIDRLFFKERFALSQAMNELPEQFAGARGPAALWTLAGDALSANLRPTSCVILGVSSADLVSLYCAGELTVPEHRVPPSLLGWLSTLTSAVKADRRSIANAGAEGRAMLEQIETAVVIPVRRGARVEAFVCLGEKRSGDIYTQTDLTLLTSLMKALSLHLLRFDEAELLERSQTLQKQMRRYVPGEVADAITRGETLETGEREVSVLFVDIRGYTALTVDRDAAEVFTLVNRYTELASSIVKECGGVIVEFNGDGMMAVFGAPRAIEHKERAAVIAARRLMIEVPKLVAPGSGDAAFAVGVGVATGAAFVGNIEAADRVIWSAIGSTTNLAARLQTLTRTLDVGVLIDAMSHERAGESASDFAAYENVAIRGRPGVDTVFGLA